MAHVVSSSTIPFCHAVDGRVQKVLDCSNEMTILEFLVQSPEGLVKEFFHNWSKQASLWRKTYMDVVVGGLLVRGNWKDYSFFSPEDWDALFSECLMRHSYPLAGRFLQALQTIPFEWMKPLVDHCWGKHVVGDLISWCTALGRVSCASLLLDWSIAQYPSFAPNVPKLPLKHEEDVLTFVQHHRLVYGYTTTQWAYIVLNHYTLGEDKWCFDIWETLDACWRLSAIEEWLFDEHNGALPEDVAQLLNEDELLFLGRGSPFWMTNKKHFSLTHQINSLKMKKTLTCALSGTQKDDTDKSGRLM